MELIKLIENEIVLSNLPNKKAKYLLQDWKEILSHTGGNCECFSIHPILSGNWMIELLGE